MLEDVSPGKINFSLSSWIMSCHGFHLGFFILYCAWTMHVA